MHGQLALLAAHLPFAHVGELLPRLLGLSLSPTTCQRQVGQWMQSHASDGESDALGATVSVSMDGTMTHDRAEGWAEIRVGSVYTTTGKDDAIRAVQHSYVVDHHSVES